MSIPKREIEWLIAREHVSRPDAEIEALIRSRLENSLISARRIRSCVRYALECHHHNQDLYRAVSSGNFGRSRAAKPVYRDHDGARPMHDVREYRACDPDDISNKSNAPD